MKKQLTKSRKCSLIGTLTSSETSIQSLKGFCRHGPAGAFRAGTRSEKFFKNREKEIEKALFADLRKSAQEAAQKAAQEKEARRKEAEEHPERAAMAEMVQEGSRYIQRIREINNDLPDPVVSAKLDDLEKVCQQIFAYVGDHPDKLPEIRKFMSYYLPTTLKLLEAYRKLAHQNTGTESEEKTEQEILAAVDNINLAFQNLLNELMEDDYLDLSSDISVLQSMLSQEGLVDDFSSSQSEKEKEADEKKREPDLSLDPFAELSRMESELSKDTPPEPELHL